MLKLILLLMFSVTHFAQAQIDADKKKTFTRRDSLDYIRKAVDFLTQVKQTELADSNYWLIDNSSPVYYRDMLNTLLTLPDLLSKDEIRMIQQSEYPAALKWKSAWFEHTKVLSSDTLAETFNVKSKGWPYFNAKYGKGYHNFSMPIFLRNDSVCIFYSDIYSGKDSEDGSLFMYRKENKIWIRLKYPEFTWVD